MLEKCKPTEVPLEGSIKYSIQQGIDGVSEDNRDKSLQNFTISDWLIRLKEVIENKDIILEGLRLRKLEIHREICKASEEGNQDRVEELDIQLEYLNRIIRIIKKLNLESNV